MPYRPFAQRQREKWFSLPELVAHIRETDGCTPEAAQVQVRQALADDALRPQDDPGSDPILIPFFVGWRGVRDTFWRDAGINWQASTVMDGTTERPVMIDKAKALEIWSPSEALGEKNYGKPRRGPQSGTVGYRRADYELYPDLERLMSKGLSRSAAARKLAYDNKIPGAGVPENRARRLARRHRREHE